MPAIPARWLRQNEFMASPDYIAKPVLGGGGGGRGGGGKEGEIRKRKGGREISSLGRTT